MTDRELLELAAKAAGIDGWWSGADYCYGYNGNKNVPVPWRPLTDDGDALRLAVKLRLQVTPGTYKSDEFTVYRSGYAECHEYLHYLQEPYAATRRAIVRAAAEIGKAVQNPLAP